ncbi:MAG: hypothetical protein H6728_03640 [Myxococcales bacterium]|nr:hypothetical protein [Myxococcales bacterium]
MNQSFFLVSFQKMTLLGLGLLLFLFTGCQKGDPNALIQEGKSGYICRLQIEGNQPIEQVIAIFKQRLRQAGVKEFKTKLIKRRKLQIDVKKVRLSRNLSILLQSQGRLGLYRFIEDIQPLYPFYRKLSPANQKALSQGPALQVLEILHRHKKGTRADLDKRLSASRPSSQATTKHAAHRPTTKPHKAQGKDSSTSKPTSMQGPSRQALRELRRQEDLKERKNLGGQGHHLFFGSSRTRMESALNSLELPKSWRGKVRFLWQRTVSRRYWKVYMVEHKAIVTEADLNQTSTVLSTPDVGSLGTQLSLSFSSEAAQRLADATGKMLKKRLAVAFDDQLYVAPKVQETLRSGTILLSPSYDLSPKERVQYLRAWRILLGLPPLEHAPTLLYVRRLRAF